VRRYLAGLCLLGLAGCGSSDDPPAASANAHHGLTCDFLDHTLCAVAIPWDMEVAGPTDIILVP
jgi:hypothetical protein